MTSLRWLESWALPLLLGLAVLQACSSNGNPPLREASAPPREASAPREASSTESSTPSRLELVVREDLLTVIEASFLKGRCLARLSVDAKTPQARAALVTFAKQVADGVPLDGSKPKNDNELKSLVPGSGVVAGWDEDMTDGVKGPWLITTSAFDWIDGGGKPFADNGFEAAAGERYFHAINKWHLNLDLVDMGSTQGAAAAFKAAQWNEGNPP